MTDVEPEDGPLSALFRRRSGGGNVPAPCPPPEHVQAARMGVLPPAALALVERHVAECAMCSALADALDDVPSATLSADVQERLRQKVHAAIAAEPRSGSPRPSRMAIAAAAAILLVGVVSVLVWQRKSPTSEDVPSVLQVQPPAARTGPNADLLWRGSTTSEADDLERAIQPYSERNFAEAVRRLEDVVRRYPQSALANLHLGASLLMVHQPTEALPALERAEQLSGDPELTAEAGWYVALALLGGGENTRGLQKLESICRSGTARAERACAGARELRAQETPRR